MIEITKTVTPSPRQMDAVIRGMRNPLNSWDKSDSMMGFNGDEPVVFVDGKNDKQLMMRLASAGTDHRKFMRMMTVWVDINAPLYWHKEMDTYRFGVEKNSCSTMHKITSKPFEVEDFSVENLDPITMDTMNTVIDTLNHLRDMYNDENSPFYHNKRTWYQIIQLLPSSYNQKRTYMISYEALANIYHARKNHKLDEWHMFCKWIENLNYSYLITGGELNE